MLIKLQHTKTYETQQKEFLQGNLLIFHDYNGKQNRKSMT